MIVELTSMATAADPGCSFLDAVCMGTQLVEGVKNAFWSEQLEVFMGAWRQAEMFMFAGWIATPNLVDITNPDGTAMWLQRMLIPLTYMFAVLGAMTTALWTFFKLRSEKLIELGWSFGWFLLISTSGALIIATLAWGVQMMSVGLLLLVGVNTTSTFITDVAASVGPGLPAIVSFIGVVGVIIQIIIMTARNAILPLLAGLWPMAAAVNTLPLDSGKKAFRQINAWLAAFIIYVFPAALVYAAAFRLKTGGDGIGGLIYGMVLQLIAIFMMPAIFRIIAPQVQALGKAYGGEIAVKAAAQVAELAVAVGAAVVTAGAAAGAMAGRAGGQALQKTAQSSASGGPAATGTGPGGSPHGSGGGTGDGKGSGATGETQSPRQDSKGASTVEPPRNPQPATSGARGARPEGTQPPSQQQENRLGTRRQAAAQAAAQNASYNIRRTTEDRLNDVDETIGGKDG